MSSWILLATLAWAGGPPPDGWPIPPAESQVASVYDGDTVTLETGDKIRLRWVNTPELKPAEDFGVEAKEAAESFLSGKDVRLILDGPNPRDGYGRVLAGLETDDGNLSIHLLEKGLGHLFIIPPEDTDLKPFLEAQAKAKAAKLGIWSTDRYQGALHITSFHANARGDDRDNVNGEYLRICNVTNEAIDLKGYKITKKTGQSWTLPSVTVPAGHTFKLISGQGDNQADPAEQIEVYLQSPTPIWNNKSDTATLKDRDGQVIDSREHAVKTATP